MNLLLYFLCYFCFDGSLSRMWEAMFQCHKLQFQIISTAYSNSRPRIAAQSELRRQMAAYLENELHSLQSSFSKWIGAQKLYLEAINGWIYKCVTCRGSTGQKRDLGFVVRFSNEIHVFLSVKLLAASSFRPAHFCKNDQDDSTKKSTPLQLCQLSTPSSRWQLTQQTRNKAPAISKRTSQTAINGQDLDQPCQSLPPRQLSWSL